MMLFMLGSGISHVIAYVVSMPEELNSRPTLQTPTKREAEHVCPVCGQALLQERCKVVCRSEQCVYRIVFNCSEF